jgi:hypothetical protein
VGELTKMEVISQPEQYYFQFSTCQNEYCTSIQTSELWLNGRVQASPWEKEQQQQKTL